MQAVKATVILTIVAALPLVWSILSCTPPPPESEQSPEQTGQPAETDQPEGQSETETVETVNIKLATTTSTDNSGLLRHILPVFTERANIEVDVIAVGTGAALELGRKGDVDIILVHAPNAEEEFIMEGHGVARYYVAQNEFVIVGPDDDPAELASDAGATEAFEAIMDSGAVFVSRGDESGTHKREKQVWEAAGLNPEGEWYIEAGQGMGAVLTMSNEMEAYALTDSGTFYSMEDNLDLVIVYSGDPILENIYSIIPLNPEFHPGLKHAEAMELVEWITGPEAVELIDGFEVNGHRLFRVEQ